MPLPLDQGHLGCETIHSPSSSSSFILFPINFSLYEFSNLSKINSKSSKLDHNSKSLLTIIERLLIIISILCTSFLAFEFESQFYLKHKYGFNFSMPKIFYELKPSKSLLNLKVNTFNRRIKYKLHEYVCFSLCFSL